MFKHTDRVRSFHENYRLAAFLSLSAGLVNICGVLALGVLTTNVTGHFAFFAQNVKDKSLHHGLNFLFYILCFLSGSFVSGFLTEYAVYKKFRRPHYPAMFFEIILLCMVGLFGDFWLRTDYNNIVLAGLMLFSMGLQNALVTVISKAKVRTTHLTGLFTDLGIELSQLFFFREKLQYKQLVKSIRLRNGIIAFFFLGCVIGDLIFPSLQFNVLIVAAGVLILALLYDRFRILLYRVWIRILA